jgi:hypothetical protein
MSDRRRPLSVFAFRRQVAANRSRAPYFQFQNVIFPNAAAADRDDRFFIGIPPGQTVFFRPEATK